MSFSRTSRTRTTKVVALSAIGTLGLAGCSTASDDTPQTDVESVSAEQCIDDGTTTLNVSHAASSAPSIEMAIEAMEAKYPALTVDAVESSAASYTEMAQQMIADKAGGKTIDVGQVGTDQIRLFADTYGLAPIDPSTLPDTFDPAYLPVGEIDGELFAVPFQISLPAMYLNTDALEAAGLPADTQPTTLDEVLELAQTLKDAGDYSSVVGINNGPSSDDWFLQAMIESNGGELGEDGRAAFDSDAGFAAVSFYQTAAEQELLMHAPTTDTVGAFASGQLPILFQSTAGITGYGDLVGDAFEWSVALMPTTDSPSYAAGGNAFMPLSDTACGTVLANEFISLLVAPENLLPSLSEYTYQPVDTEVRDTLLESDATNPKAKPIMTSDAAFSARSHWPETHTPEVQQIIADMMENIVAGADAQTELTNAAEAVNNVVG